MNFSEYKKQIKKYVSPDLNAQDDRAAADSDGTHYILGMVTEVAELADLQKKWIAQGKPVNVDHVRAEVGDLLWYLGNFMDVYGLTLEECLEHNLKKLEIRYGNSYSHEAALAKRDKAQGGF